MNGITYALQTIIREYVETFGESFMKKLERQTLVAAIDNCWAKHLTSIDYLKQGVGLRAYSQRDPLTEFEQDSYDMFASLVDDIHQEYVRLLLNVSNVAKNLKSTAPSIRAIDTDAATIPYNAHTLPSASENLANSPTFQPTCQTADKPTHASSQHSIPSHGKHAKSLDDNTCKHTESLGTIRGKHAKLKKDNDSLYSAHAVPSHGKHAKPTDNTLSTE